jgi:hypothetical protein
LRDADKESRLAVVREFDDLQLQGGGERIISCTFFILFTSIDYRGTTAGDKFKVAPAMTMKTRNVEL